MLFATLTLGDYYLCSDYLKEWHFVPSAILGNSVGGMTLELSAALSDSVKIGAVTLEWSDLLSDSDGIGGMTGIICRHSVQC